MPRHFNTRCGFTLIELMVALAVVGVLVALLLPAVQSARATARRAQCQNQLRQLCQALHNYHDAHRVLPAGSYAAGPGFFPLSGWGWGSMILPYCEQRALYQSIDFDIGTAVGSNREVIQQPVALWRCPSDSAPVEITVKFADSDPAPVAAGNYCGVSPILAELSRTRFRDVIDGLSNTLFIGERVYQPSRLGGPEFTSSWVGQVATEMEMVNQSIPHLEVRADIAINESLLFPHGFTSRHAGGAHFAFGDGATRLLSDTMDSGVYEALGTPDGGEAVSF